MVMLTDGEPPVNCCCDPGRCIVGGLKPMVGSPKAKWSLGKGQTKSNSQDSDGNTEPWHPPGARPWEGSWSASL